MKLVVQGKCFRTSGSAAPFGQFENDYGDVASLFNQEIDLPYPNCFFLIEGKEDALLISLSVEGERKSILLTKGQQQTCRVERNILGVEITFSLKE